MRIFKWALLGLLVSITGFAIISAYFAQVLTQPPRKPVHDVPPELPVTTQPVTFAARDGLKLSGWFVPREQATKAIVLLHGNGSSRNQMVARARLFHDAGYAHFSTMRADMV